MTHDLPFKVEHFRFGCDCPQCAARAGRFQALVLPVPVVRKVFLAGLRMLRDRWVWRKYCSPEGGALSASHRMRCPRTSLRRSGLPCVLGGVVAGLLFAFSVWGLRAETNPPPASGVTTNGPAEKFAAAPATNPPPRTAIKTAPSYAAPSSVSRRRANGHVRTNSSTPAQTNGSSQPPTRSSVTGTDFRSFRILSERNIFDPDRQSRRDRQRRSQYHPPPPVTDSVALLGTFSYAKGSFAVFGGSRSDFRKVIQPSDAIAGLKLLKVAPDYVTLEVHGEPVKLEVGKELARSGTGPWKVTQGSSASSPTEAAPPAASESKGSGSSDNESEILKRLMRKRQQELNHGKT